MSISLPGCCFSPDQNNKEGEQVEAPFKEEKKQIVITGGGVNPLILKSLSRKENKDQELLNPKIINPLPHFKGMLESLLKEDIQKLPNIDPIRNKEMSLIPFWKDLLESSLEEKDSFPKEKKSFLKEDTQESTIHSPCSLLEYSFNICFRISPKEKILPFLLSHTFPVSIIKQYNKNYLHYTIVERYERFPYLSPMEKERKKIIPCRNPFYMEPFKKNIIIDYMDRNILLHEWGCNDYFYMRSITNVHQPRTLKKLSFHACFTEISEESLMTFFISDQMKPLSQKYIQLFLAKQKLKIIKRREMFCWKRIKAELLSRFPSIIKNDNDLESIISPSLISFLQYFSPSNFKVKRKDAYDLLEYLIGFERFILYDLFESRFPPFFESFTLHKSLSQEKNSLDVLEKIQCTTWILIVYTKIQIFCAQTFKTCYVRDYKRAGFLDPLFQWQLLQKKKKEQKSYFFKKFKLCLDIQTCLVQLKNAYISSLKENYEISHRKLTQLVEQLGKLTEPERNNHRIDLISLFQKNDNRKLNRFEMIFPVEGNV